MFLREGTPVHWYVDWHFLYFIGGCINIDCGVEEINIRVTSIAAMVAVETTFYSRLCYSWVDCRVGSERIMELLASNRRLFRNTVHTPPSHTASSLVSTTNYPAQWYQKMTHSLPCLPSQAPGENFKENNPFEDLPNRVLHPWPAMQEFQFHVRWIHLWGNKWMRVSERVIADDRAREEVTHSNTLTMAF